MTVALSGFGLYALYHDISKANDSLDSSLDYIPLACVLVFEFAFSTGVSPISWLLLGEVFPLEFRALGTALAAVVWLKVQLENGQLMKDYKEELNKWFFSVIEEEDVEIAINATIGVLVVATLASMAYLVVSSLLIHGARRCREGLLTPWIIFALIFVVSNIINIIVCFIHE